MNFQASKFFIINFLIWALLSLSIILGSTNSLLNSQLDETSKLEAHRLLKTSLIMYETSLKDLETICFKLKILINNNNIPTKTELGPIKKENQIVFIEIITKKDVNNIEFKELRHLLKASFKGKIIVSNEIYKENISQIVVLPLSKETSLLAIRYINNNSIIIHTISKSINNPIIIEKLADFKKKNSEKAILTALNNSSEYNGDLSLHNRTTTGAAALIKNFNNNGIAVISLGINPLKYKHIKQEITLLILITFIVTIAVMVIVALISDNYFIKGLNDIKNGIQAAKDGDFTQKIRINKQYSFSILAESLNEMFDAMLNREYDIKSYQEELRSKKENLEAIFNSSTDGIMTLSSDLKIISVNPTITQWAGIPSEKIVGHHFNEFVKCNCHLKMSDIDCNNPSICPIAAHWTEEMPKEGHITNKTTGRTTFIGLNCSPIHGLAKAKESFVAVLMDITQFKELEKVKENFVATLTHDLRVPLLAENHALKYLLKGSYGQLIENQKIAAENMLTSNEDLLKLVNTLLDVYKYESGRSQLYKEDVDLHELANECISELSPLIIKHSQTIECNVPKDLFIVTVDRNEIKRVLMNLIGNAISYTQENGKINIESEKNNSNIIIKIIDNGKGIPENELKNIFDRYFTSAKKFRKVGTGLGLYLSKQIITAHNGKIWVESKQGQGSTFYFSLPLNIEDTY